MTQDNTPRIYVACLSAYVNGKLHGEWIDCDRDADDIWKEIEKMLEASPEPDAEEWAIHAFENWHGIEISENEDIESIAELAELIEEHGKAFAVYCQHYGTDASVEDFQDSYMGEYEDEEDFVYRMWEDVGTLKQLEEIGINEFYIDWSAVARDWFINDYFSVEVGYKETYIFRHY
ncbi:antirestriction protein ArdA [Calothrix sp. CCY 0018]|uniref:antirestriction protein ArdA n=1 Tax=Calothrix sp. CCY 0018 TaxID=3103864 RepID=UPI0039C5C7CB